MPSIAIPKVPNFIPVDSLQRSIVRPIVKFGKRNVVPLFK